MKTDWVFVMLVAAIAGVSAGALVFQWANALPAEGFVGAPVFEVTRADCPVDQDCKATVWVRYVVGPDGEPVSWCYKCDEFCIPDELLCAVPGDLDGDGDVDLKDFAMFQLAFGSGE